MTHTEVADDPGWKPPDLASSYRRRQELIGEFLDDAEVADQQLAVAAAARVRSIEQLRQVAVQNAVEEEAEDAARPPELRANRGQEAGWSIKNRAATELSTEIAMAFTISKTAARLLVEESATLVADLPRTLEALEAGDVRYEHVRVIASTAWSLPVDARAAFEVEVLPWAKTLILAAFRVKLLKVKEKVDTTSMAERHEKAAIGRNIRFEPADDGMGYLTIHDSTEVLVAIYNRATDIAHNSFTGDPRTLAQRRVDITTQLLLTGDLCATVDDAEAAAGEDGDGNPTMDGTGTGTGPATGKRLGHGILARVTVDIPVLTLLGVETTPATLEGTIPIDPITARKLVADAPGFYRLLTDPITGSVIAFDDKFRYLPASLRRAVEHVDGTCTAPWCNASAHTADGHHPDEWATNHTTSLENSALLCPGDHRLIHNTRWTMVKLKNGDKQWISPCGRTKKVTPLRRLSPAFIEALTPDTNTNTNTNTPAKPDQWNTPTNTTEEMPF